MRLRLALSSALLTLLSASAASAAPGLLVGVVDNSLMWTHQPAPIVAVQRDLGLGAIRLSVRWRRDQWSPTSTQVTELNRAVRAGGGDIRVVLSISGFGADAPHDRLQQDRFCGFAFNLLSRFPTVDDVVIWNETNTSHFWRPQFAEDGTSAAPEEYAGLLLRCYDLLHGLRPGINVISGSTAARGNDNPRAKSPSHSPARFIRELAKGYREQGRQRRIFDTYGHHPYPNSSAERPSVAHPGGKAIGQGDYQKLVATLTAAFRGTGQPVPGRRGVGIWYLENGFQTAVPSDKAPSYDGSENDAHAVSPEAGGTQLAEAVRLAYCQPLVKAYFNFELVDDRSLAGWQSGLLWADWTQKPAYAAFKQTIADVARGAVDCSLFSSRAR
jgi:hypothetical protein